MYIVAWCDSKSWESGDVSCDVKLPVDTKHRLALFPGLPHFYFLFVFRINTQERIALSPGSPQKWGEPGNICGKGCQLPPPCSGGTNQIAELNHVYMWHFVHSAKKMSTQKWTYSIGYTLKVGEKQFLDVRKRSKSEIKVCCSWFVGPTHSPYSAAPSLHVQSESRNSTHLQMPRRRGAKV